MGRCHLLQAPPEIRSIIYRLVLYIPVLLHHPMSTEDKAQYQRWWLDNMSESGMSPFVKNKLGTGSTVFTLLYTSRLISHEAIPVFYSINKFRFLIFSYPIVTELPSQLSHHIKRLFLPFELHVHVPDHEAASYITKMARKIATSGASLETFTLIFWARTGPHTTRG